MHTFLRWAAILVVTRLAILWTGLLLYSGYSDWRQVVGYIALIANSLLELLIVRNLREQGAIWSLTLTVAVTISSALIATGLAWWSKQRL